MESACNVGKNLPAMQETWVWSLGWEDPLEKGTATHSSILTWRILWTVQSWGHKESDATKRLSFHFFHIHSVIFFLCSNPSSVFPLYISFYLKDALDEAERNPSLSSAKLDTLWSHHRLFSEAMRYYPIWPIMDNSAKPAVNSIFKIPFLMILSIVYILNLIVTYLMSCQTVKWIQLELFSSWSK